MDIKGQILEIVEAFNQSWISREFDQLGQYLDDKVVFVSPDGGLYVKGKKNCIATFEEFTSQVATQHYKRCNEKVELWGKTAVASYEFLIDYQVGEKSIQEKGRNIMVFNRGDGDWKVVYRTLLPL